MGRPAGSRNGESFLMPWRPLTWKPAYDIMVSLHASGYSNVKIAEMTDYSAVQVGNILRSPEAQRMIAEARTNVTKSIEGDMKSRLSKLQEKALQRVEQVIFDDERAAASPVTIMEKSMSLLKGLGLLAGENNPSVVQHNKTLVISESVAARLFDGMALADHVKSLHSGDESKDG